MKIGAIAQTRENIYCPFCNQDIYKCDDCGEYFAEGEKICCDEQTGQHFCSDCRKEE